jgi:hypothetical protein
MIDATIIGDQSHPIVAIRHPKAVSLHSGRHLITLTGEELARVVAFVAGEYLPTAVSPAKARWTHE